MKLSLLTVCINSEATIADTIQSVLSQDYTDLEYIIFDGGSQDQTVSIIKSFGSRVKLVEGNDSGIYDAINQAIAYASGSVVGIINSDDFYAHNQVLTQVMNRFSHEKVDAVYGDLHYVLRSNPDKVYRKWLSGDFRMSHFKYGWMPPHPTFFVRKSIYKKYGAFNDAFKISGDYELILRLLYKHQISVAYINEVLVKMRTGGKSDGDMKGRLQSLKEDYKAWKINGLTPAFYTIPFKPLRKLGQFI